MGSCKVVESLPLSQFGFQIDISLVAEELVELLAIRSVGPFDLAIELGRTWLDIGVSYPLVLDVPMELGLEFMAIVGSNFSDPEGELVDDIVDEVDGVGLGVFPVDLEGPHAGCIIDSCELETPYLLAALPPEGQELPHPFGYGDRELVWHSA